MRAVLLAAAVLVALAGRQKQTAVCLVSWGDAQAVDGFVVLQGTAPGTYSVSYRTTNHYITTGALAAGARYYFTAYAVRGGTNGPKAAEVSVLVPAVVPRRQARSEIFWSQ